MKRAPLLITLGIIALSVAGYFVYEKYFQKKIVSPWDLVPQGAVAVYESSACASCIEPVKASSLWEIIKRASFYDKQQDSIQSIVSLLTAQRVGSLASLHVTKKDAFDFVFYIPLNDLKGRQLFEATVEDWKNKKGINYKEREFNGAKIQELSTSTSVFSWVVLKDVWIGSFSPFLVEDVIRVFDEGKESTFRKDLSAVYQMPKLKNDAGNLYIHLTKFSDWLSVFAPGFNLDLIKHFGKATLLDIKAVDKNLVLNGFSIDAPQEVSALSVFNDQFPTSFGLKQFVSNRTILLISYGISSGKDFVSKLNQYPNRNKRFADTLQQLSTSLKVNIGDLYSSINNEVGLCHVESAGEKYSKVLLVESNEIDKWMTVLNTLSEKLSVDTVFYERYSGYEIRELPIYRFPEKLFSPFVNGFDHTYYTTTGNTLILAENIDELKLFLEDIDREDTWGKSVAQNQFLESTLLESNVSLYINTPRIWNTLGESLNEKWKKFLQQNQSLFASVGMGAIQFSHLNQSFYTNISWLYQQPSSRSSETKSSQSVITGFQAGLLGKPHIVRSHVDKTNEVLVQDSSYQIHLISSKGTVLWTKELNGPIAGDVFQIDYFKNGKLQYLFLTEGLLHIIDRLGNYVQLYPLLIKSKQVQFLSLIDYDHSRNYRFLVTDKSGKLWMYDKEGNNLEGWTPRNVEGELFCAPRHHRIRSKDYLLALRKDGKAYLMNRRGESIKGFPTNLDARPAGDYFLESGASSSQTHFVVVSSDGFRIKFNLDGKIYNRETLLKSSLDARFSMIEEVSGKSYCIVRQEPKSLSVINGEGKEVIKNEYIGMNNINVQYYDFGAGNAYYLITDLTQDLNYVYDRQGNLIASPPFEGDFAQLAMTNSDKLLLYLTYQKSLHLKPLL
ncbi:MAG TPA: hypothetical protein VFW11_24180 [Cyclobacteriaceae bacterium]|nr:hypothetical protein [Cyclobacteriaceae bacterium]